MRSFGVATLSEEFPVWWMAGLLGFLLFFWWVWETARGTRAVAFALWAPSAVVAGMVYGLDGHGIAVVDLLRDLVQRDRATLDLLSQVPVDTPLVAYALVVGGAVAVMGAMLLQVLALVVGALVGLLSATDRPDASRPRPAVPAATPSPGPAEPADPNLRYQVLLTQVTSLLLFTRKQTKPFVGTAHEVQQRYRRVLAHNLLLGWWGFPFGLLWTPLALWRNASAIGQLEHLATKP